MGKLFIPAEQNIKGPWLLDQSCFENLNEIIEYIYDKLLDSFENNSSKHHYTKSDFVKKITITTKSKVVLSDNSLLGILKDHKLKDLKPVDIYIEIGKNYSGNVFRLSISSDSDGRLEYSIECINEEIKDDIKYKIDNWIEQYKPSKLIHFWSYILPQIISGFAFFWFIILLVFLFEKPSNNYKDELKFQADSLINVGITTNNYDQAIDILLKLQSEYVPQNVSDKFAFQPKVFKVLLISILVYLIFTYTPKTTIGIGKYRNKVKLYKLWKKLFFYIIPIGIVLPRLINYLIDSVFK